MLMKTLFGCGADATEEQYREHQRGLQIFSFFLLLIGLATVLFSAFAVPLLVADAGRVDFCSGMYAGIGAAVMAIAVVVFVSTWRLLHNETRFRRAYTRDTDERNIEIGNRAVRAAGLTLACLLYAALLVAGLFWPELFWFCYAAAVTFSVLVVLFRVYYERKL